MGTSNHPQGAAEVDPALVERYAADIHVLPPGELTRRNGLETIGYAVTETASEAELRQLACRRNASHGHRLSRVVRWLATPADFGEPETCA